MKYEPPDYLIYYNKCDQNYLAKLIDIIELKLPKLKQLFKIQDLGRITIKLYDNLETYKDNIINSFLQEAKKNNTRPRKYQNWMIANTCDGNLNFQSLTLVRLQQDFANYTEDEFCLNVAHELVHICQQKVGSSNPGWFWEVLATTYGNPENQTKTNEPFSLQDLQERFDQIDGYGAAYKIGKYLQNNYDEDYIYDLIIDNNKLSKVQDQLITKSQIATQNKKK